MCRSEPQMPQATTRSSTSSAAGFGGANVVDAQRTADAVEDRGLHLRSSSSVRRVGNQGASTTLQISPQMPPRANSAMNSVRSPSTTR